MEVERLEMFEFKVTFDEQDFSRLKLIADEYNQNPNDMLLHIMESGLSDYYNALY